MTPQELAEKFSSKVAAALVERERQASKAVDETVVRTQDIEHCKNALARNVLPFLSELKDRLPAQQFSFAPQIDMHDHKPVGVSFRLGDGPATTIVTAFGNIVVTRVGDSGSSKGVAFVYPPHAEPYISNSGDLTRDKISKLIEMVMDLGD
jgi:hypothetical protein